MAYEQYTGRCTGTLLKYLYKYSYRADTWIFDEKGVYEDSHCKNLIATYFWMNDTDVPIFKFTKKYEFLYSTQNYNIKYIIAWNRFGGENYNIKLYGDYIHKNKWDKLEEYLKHRLFNYDFYRKF